MTPALLSEFYERDLRRVIEEVNLYRHETNLWQLPAGISNTAGNLCLHLVGNLRHFIGATLGKTGYVRQRELEFSSKNISRTQLLYDLETTIQMVNLTLVQMPDGDLEKDFPLQKHGETVTTLHMLLHLLTHLNYHLGQINYHRRMVEGK